MVQASSSSAGLRAIKRVEQTLQDLGVCLFTVGCMLTILGIWNAICSLNHIYLIQIFHYLSVFLVCILYFIVNSFLAWFSSQNLLLFLCWQVVKFCLCSYKILFQVHVKPKVPTKAVCSEHLELRRDILTLLTLQKQVQMLLEVVNLQQNIFEFLVFPIDSSCNTRKWNHQFGTVDLLKLHAHPRSVRCFSKFFDISSCICSMRYCMFI